MQTTFNIADKVMHTPTGVVGVVKGIWVTKGNEQILFDLQTQDTKGSWIEPEYMDADKFVKVG